MSMLTPFERKGYDLFNAFHEFEDDFFKGNQITSCKTDIKDEGDRFVLESELPGFEKEDIKLDLNGDCLTISAQHSTNKEEKDKKGSYVRRERSCCSYQRSFNVSECNPSGIDAEYKNGVLIVTLPKKQETQPSSRRLEIR
ncbi:MAG: Hsp20/alpha crystallin family protein [Bacteroides sp.]|nr:Hsp20/alpha crystallin family protein [Bacteroides sp.]